MRYFHLWAGVPPDNWDRPWIVRFDESDVAGLVSLEKGITLENWDPNTRGRCPDASFTVDFSIASGRSWPILSLRMKRFLDSICPSDVQYLPFRLVNDSDDLARSGREMYLGNVLTIVDCIDRVRTKVRNNDWTPRPNGSFQVRYPIWLARKAIGDSRFFRIKGYFSPMIVREDVKEEIEAGDFRGVVFVREMPVSDD